MPLCACIGKPECLVPKVKGKGCHLKIRPLLSRDRLAQLLWELASAPEELFHLGSGLDSGRRLGQVRQEFWVGLVEI